MLKFLKAGLKPAGQNLSTFQAFVYTINFSFIQKNNTATIQVKSKRNSSLSAFASIPNPAVAGLPG